MMESGNELEKKIEELIKKNTKLIAGRISARELSETAFLNALFKNFTIESPSHDSPTKVRMAVQKILQNNLRESIGMYHSKELNDSVFIRELLLNFNFKDKTNERTN